MKGYANMSEINVHFKELTSKTVLDVCRLSYTLSPPHQNMVADNAVSIAQAHFSDKTWFRAIYDRDTIIGFIMTHTGSDFDDGIDVPGVFLWRFMIGGSYQGKGYGRKAIELLVQDLVGQGFQELETSCGQGEGSPEGFYRKMGFVATGEMFDDEIGLILYFT